VRKLARCFVSFWLWIAIVLASFLLTTPAQGRRFLIAFCIGYVVYLVFETVALVRYVDNEKKKRQN